MAIVTFSKKKAHQIYRLTDKSIVPGGSTVSKIGESQDHLINWANKQGLEGLDNKRIMDESAHIGTVCHGYVQCHFNNDDPNFDEFSKIEIDLGYKLYLKFLKSFEEQGLTFISSEQQLVSETYRYGGTLDLICLNKDKLLTLADIKTSPRIYGHFYRQIASYENLYNETARGAEKIEKRVIFRLDKTDPELTEVRWMGAMDKHFEVFLRQLDLYYAFKKL